MELQAKLRALALVALTASLLAAAGALPPPAPAAEPELRQPARSDRAPEGFRLTALQAIAIAERVEKVRGERLRRPALEPTAYTKGAGRWQVSYFEGKEERAQVQVDDADGRVLEAWTGPQVAWHMARGYDGAFGRGVTSPWVWLPLCALFLAPFVDPRRPFRLLHLDLLMLLAFGVSHVFFNRGEISASVPLAYPVLAYLLVRMLVLGLRPGSRPQRLLPIVPAAWLALAIVGLMGFRVALNVVDSNVIDVGYAGVIGADRIADGKPLYEGGFPSDNRFGDTYGPVNYLAYVPFEQALPWSGRWDDLPAAHAAALAFDGATLAGLILLGRRLRRGAAGRELGLALGFAWVAYPYALYALSSNANDALVAMLLVYALLLGSSPWARGALLGFAGAAKFAPLALVPLLARDPDGGGRRAPHVLAFAAALAAVTIASALPFVPDGGPTELYERTLGRQLVRESPFSLWGQYPALRWTQRAVAAGAVALGLVVAFVPRRLSRPRVAALGAAVLIALQLSTTHWFYLYIVWFAPFAFVALFAAHGTGPAEASARRHEQLLDRARAPVARSVDHDGVQPRVDV